MGKVLCFLYQDLAEFEVAFLFHRLKTIGRKEVISIGVNCDPVRSQSGFIFMPDCTVKEAFQFDDTEALVIPGGPITPSTPDLTGLIQKLNREEKLLAAICNGPQFLGRAGILDNRQFTTSCSEERLRNLGIADPFPRRNFLNQRVVRDQNVITATGRAFIDFSFAVFDWLHIFKTQAEMEELLKDIRGC